MRPVRITRGYIKFVEGSVLMEMGDTRVICAATVEDKVPPFLKGKGSGWITAEYSMLPRSSKTRIPRESHAGRLGGRTHEIQRLIGRSLRLAFDLNALGERTITVDCDVIQADGGTRTASITGAYIAVVDAIDKVVKDGRLKPLPAPRSVSAVSVGIIDGEACLDLNYAEDSAAEVDMNVVMTGDNGFVEVQGTAEGDKPFSREAMDGLLDLGRKGCKELALIQARSLKI